jgi:hypothetical protein
MRLGAFVLRRNICQGAAGSRGLSAQQSKSKFSGKRFEAIDCVIESTVCCSSFQLVSGKRLKNWGKTMITFIRSASIAPGKTGDAIAFAHQIGKHIKEKYGITVELLMPVGGNPNRIAWHAHYESLAQLEALAAKLLADTEYMGTIAKNSATWLPGSVHDEIWRTI